MKPTPEAGPSSKELADRVTKSFFGDSSDPASHQAAIRSWLVGASVSAVLIPIIFYLRFGEVGGLGWGTTTFFVAYCLLSAIGLYFLPRTDYHTPVPLKGDWADRVGAFWLVSCVFGPLLSWIIASVIPLTPTNWQWLYTLRVFLAAGLPLITALPLLIVITLLPIMSVVNVSQDIAAGPIVRQVQATNQVELYLPYTEQSLGHAK